MSITITSPHPVAQRRKSLGWSQEDLAGHSGLPRSSVSSIEAGRLTPSVAAALAVARALDCSVEELFGGGGAGEPARSPTWAWEPHGGACRYWEAEVGGKRILYPAEAMASQGWAHDGTLCSGVLRDRKAADPRRTLVLAGCDPAAGLLAAEYAAASEFRMLTFSRGGAAALALLRQGVVHVAALHRSTVEQPGRNQATVRESLGPGYRLLRCAEWQEGVALPSGNRIRSLESCARNIRSWAAREPGSAARECLDELTGRPLQGGGVVLSHRAVAESVKGGWAEAGVCVQLCAEEAGLRFLPVRTESLDLCFPAPLEYDPRLQALVRLLRSRNHRRLIDDLPGYDSRHMGELTTA